MIQARKLTPGLSSYSTTEQDTGVTWVDGKKIYKKTLSIGGGLTKPNKTVAHGISNMDICVECEAFSVANNVYRRFPYANTSLSVLGYVMAEVDRTNVSIYTAEDRPTWHVFATLYYTKTS